MLDKQHIQFVQEIKAQIKAAQYRALQKVNTEQITLYWNIGKTILERQLQFGWGKSIVELLAIELQKEFVGTEGFSARNLWRMRNLFEQYNNSKIVLQPMVAEIPWTHNIIILEKCKDEHERLYYIHLTKTNSWSKSSLINAIEAMEPDKGILHVKTESRDNRCVAVITDNGKGMNKEHLSKLFEPYFTTKEKGTGLGLANTQNIIISHKGIILAESEEYKGSSFTVSLNYA